MRGVLWTRMVSSSSVLTGSVDVMSILCFRAGGVRVQSAGPGGAAARHRLHRRPQSQGGQPWLAFNDCIILHSSVYRVKIHGCRERRDPTTAALLLHAWRSFVRSRPRLPPCRFLPLEAAATSELACGCISKAAGRSPTVSKPTRFLPASLSEHAVCLVADPMLLGEIPCSLMKAHAA